MSETSQLKLPLLQPSQAQKHVTVNEALSVLDTVVQLGVKSAALNAPPALQADGDRYIVGPSPIDAWTGKARQIAVWNAVAWVFHQPLEGWLAWNEAGAEVLVFASGDWQSVSSGGGTGTTVPELGIGTAPDATNKLAFFGHQCAVHLWRLSGSGGQQGSGVELCVSQFQDRFQRAGCFGFAGQ